MTIHSREKSSFRVVRLTDGDVAARTDHLRTFQELVVRNEEMYPGIRTWLKDRVLPGLRSTVRTAYIGYRDERPMVSAVVKGGEHSKFCHLRIDDGFQDQHLGELFFALMAFEVRSSAHEIHFTLPESLWVEKAEFFEAFGFRDAAKAGTQYRLFESELKCSAPFSAVWKAVLEKLPKIMEHFTVGEYSSGSGLLMSIRPNHADDVLDGKKRVEIRRRFTTKWTGHRVTIYASAPQRSLVGEARIASVVVGSPERIWDEFGPDIGSSKQEFDLYTQSAREVYAVVLRDVRPYRSRIPLSQMTHLLGQDLTPPQSYCTLEKGKPWAQAVSIATLLHGTIRPAILPAIHPQHGHPDLLL